MSAPSALAAPSGAGVPAPGPVADTPLRARMWRAAGWLLGSSIASQALRLGSSLVLTRLLVPEAFGLVAAVQTLYFALVMFSDLGVWQSVVNRRTAVDARFLGTAMSVQLLRGGLLALVVLALAAGLQAGAARGLFGPATVYANPRLPWMMAVFALAALLQGAESLHLATAQRELRTADLARLELTSQLAGMVVTISLALVTRSVWSLVAGTLVATATRTALSHRLPGQRVRPAWDRGCARELLGFGRWIFLSSLIGFAAAQGEKLILGGTLDATAFGVFSIAATLLAALTGLLGSLNAHLIFPGLSEALRQGPAQAARVYQRVQRGADVLLGLAAGLACMAGGWVVQLLYDARYAEAAWMLQVLSLGLLAVRYQVLEQMMFARAQPAWVTGSNALRALSLAVAIPVGHAWGGTQGAVIAVAASQFAGWPLALVFKHRQGLLGWRSEAVWPLALAAGLGLGWLLDAALRALAGR